MALVAAWVVVVPVAILGLVWLLRVGEATPWHWMITAGTHVLLVGAWFSLVVAVWLRRWALGAIAVSLVLLQLFLVWPMAPGLGASAGVGTASGAAPALRLRSFNVYYGNDQVEAVAEQLLDGQVDLIALVEVTPPVVEALDRAGVADRYPHRVDRARFGTGGTAVFSRFPVEVVGTPTAEIVAVRVDDGRPGPAPTVFVVHAFPPGPEDPGGWVRALDQLDAAMEVTEGPAVAIGDFNATLDHRAYRDLLRDGRTDAHVATGRGSARSWPAGGRLPPVILIDRAVLSEELRAIGTAEQTVPGSDHRLIDVAISRR
jgi:endonuclease/exonuclease/phosphatase (EEP) superfamily protein YafD